MSDYQDIDGNPVALDKLTRDEPAWAANVIRSLRTKLEAAEAERDVLLDQIAYCVEEDGEFYLDNTYHIRQDPVTDNYWWLQRDGQKTIEVIELYDTASDAIRAWLEVRGEVDND